MPRPTARVLALLDVLQSGGTHTVGELAARLGVDERTVRRYVDHLLDLDVPVESVRGRYGGYRVAAGSRMPPLMLTDDEALATILGLVSAAPGSAAASAAESAAAKVRRVLPRPLGRKLQALLDTTAVVASTAAAPVGDPIRPETRVLLVMAEAAREHLLVGIRYRDAGGRETERTIQPYGLVARAGRWYTAAADPGHGDVRTFRLDRMLSATLLAPGDPPPAGFDPADHVLASIAQAPRAHEVSIRIRGTVERIRRALPEGLATIHPLDGTDGMDGTDASEAEPGWHRVDLRVEQLEWLPAVLAGIERPFVIERPAELRDLMAEFAQWLVRYATRS